MNREKMCGSARYPVLQCELCERQCITARTAVYISGGAVCTAVCGSVYGSVWQCARQYCGTVQQCRSVRSILKAAHNILYWYALITGAVGMRPIFLAYKILSTDQYESNKVS
jgi:hypothetical protein